MAADAQIYNITMLVSSGLLPNFAAIFLFFNDHIVVVDWLSSIQSFIRLFYVYVLLWRLKVNFHLYLISLGYNRCFKTSAVFRNHDA